MVASKSNYLGLVAQTPHEVCILQHHLSISSRKAVSTECPAVTLEEKAAILLASLFKTVCTATTTSNRGVLVLLQDGRKHNTPTQVKRLFQGHSVTSFTPSILAKGRIGTCMYLSSKYRGYLPKVHSGCIVLWLLKPQRWSGLHLPILFWSTRTKSKDCLPDW